MINYAHRGASQYAPENTLSSFYLGLIQGANGIETDVRRTKDGVLVLFHDDTLDKKTGFSGTTCDYTLAELKDMKLYGNCLTTFYDRIITLREFLEKFSQYDIRFAIELKGEGVEEDTLAMIKEFGLMERTTFTSFYFDYIRKIKELDPTARVGYLTDEGNDEDIKQLLSIQGEEIAPKASGITEEKMQQWRKLGLGVRAWGVTSVSLMKKMCRFGVDGMTVNFPDCLHTYLSCH